MQQRPLLPRALGLFCCNAHTDCVTPTVITAVQAYMCLVPAGAPTERPSAEKCLSTQQREREVLLALHCYPSHLDVSVILHCGCGDIIVLCSSALFKGIEHNHTATRTLQGSYSCCCAV